MQTAPLGTPVYDCGNSVPNIFRFQPLDRLDSPGTLWFLVWGDMVVWMVMVADGMLLLRKRFRLLLLLGCSRRIPQQQQYVVFSHGAAVVYLEASAAFFCFLSFLIPDNGRNFLCIRRTVRYLLTKRRHQQTLGMGSGQLAAHIWPLGQPFLAT